MNLTTNDIHDDDDDLLAILPSNGNKVAFHDISRYGVKHSEEISSDEEDNGNNCDQLQSDQEEHIGNESDNNDDETTNQYAPLRDEFGDFMGFESEIVSYNVDLNELTSSNHSAIEADALSVTRDNESSFEFKPDFDNHFPTTKIENVEDSDASNAATALNYISIPPLSTGSY